MANPEALIRNKLRHVREDLGKKENKHLVNVVRSTLPEGEELLDLRGAKIKTACPETKHQGKAVCFGGGSQGSCLRTHPP